MKTLKDQSEFPPLEFKRLGIEWNLSGNSFISYGIQEISKLICSIGNSWKMRIRLQNKKSMEKVNSFIRPKLSLIFY